MSAYPVSKIGISGYRRLFVHAVQCSNLVLPKPLLLVLFCVQFSYEKMFVCPYTPCKGKERPAMTIFRPTKLCTVLASMKSDSALCQLAQSPTLRCVCQQGVGLCAVLVSMESDSALCLLARSPTPRCVSKLGFLDYFNQ